MTFETVNSPRTSLLTASTTAPPLPAGYKLGNPSVFSNLVTSARYPGAIEVCFCRSPPGTADEAADLAYAAVSGLAPSSGT